MRVYLWAMVFPYFLKQFIKEKAQERRNKEEFEKISNSSVNISDGFKYFSELTLRNLKQFSIEVTAELKIKKVSKKTIALNLGRIGEWIQNILSPLGMSHMKLLYRYNSFF